MPKVLISNTGFGQASPSALALLRQHADVHLNGTAVKYDEPTMQVLSVDADIIIAGTEKISAAVIEGSRTLKLIARVGVGVDSVHMDAARAKSVSICYTPEAPSQAIPEFTLALMLNVIKHVGVIDRRMHQGGWYKPLGRMLASLHVGVVGAGRIGAQLIQLLKALYPHMEISFYDPFVTNVAGAQKRDLSDLLAVCDLVTLHLPLLPQTQNLIGRDQLALMKKDGFLINAARGGIVDEDALLDALASGHLAGAGVDVFAQEPYNGPLNQIETCVLTSHVGSATQEVRAVMEDQVVEDIIRFIRGEALLRPLLGFDFTQNA